MYVVSYGFCNDVFYVVNAAETTQGRKLFAEIR